MSAVRVAETVSVVGTRVTLVALPWLVLTRQPGPWRAALVASAVALPFVLTRLVGGSLVNERRLRGLAVGADLASALSLAVFIWVFANAPGAMAAVAAVIGVLRGLADAAIASVYEQADQDHGDEVRGRGPRRLGALLLGLVGGGLCGVLVSALGVTGVGWLLGMWFCLSAALVAWSLPRPGSTVWQPALSALTGPSAAVATLDGEVVGLSHTEPDHESIGVTAGRDAAGSPAGGSPRPGRIARLLRGPRSYSSTFRDRGVLTVSGLLLGAELCGQGAAVMLIAGWLREPVGSPVVLGLIGSAFLIGATGGRMVIVRAGRALTQLGLLIGLLAASIPFVVLRGLSPYVVAVAAVSFVVGVAVSSVGATAHLDVNEVVTADRARGRAVVAAALGLAVPIGSALGGAASGLSLLVVTAIAGALLLIAVLLPMVGQWSKYPPLDERFGGVDPANPGLVGLTLAYAYGQWTVEVSRGRRVFGQRHPIKPTAALKAVDVLAVPGVREEIEQIVAADRTLAEKHAERLRAELEDVGAKLNAMNEIVELTELRKATPS